MEALAKCEELPGGYDRDVGEGEWQVLATNNRRIGTIYTNGTHSHYVADDPSGAKGLVVRFCGVVWCGVG